MIRLPVVRQQLVDRRLTVLLLLLLDILVKWQTHQDAELILQIDRVQTELVQCGADRLHDHILRREYGDIRDMQLIESGQVIDGPGQDQIDLSFIPELLRIRGDMPVVVVRVLKKVRTVLLLYILRHFHIVVRRRQEITEYTIQLRLRMVDLKLQQDRQHIDRLIGREGTWDTVIRKLVLDIVIAQLAREENDIALSLHILVDGIDVTHLSIDILKKLTAEIMLCDDLLYRLK